MDAIEITSVYEHATALVDAHRSELTGVSVAWGDFDGQRLAVACGAVVTDERGVIGVERIGEHRTLRNLAAIRAAMVAHDQLRKIAAGVRR